MIDCTIHFNDNNNIYDVIEDISYLPLPRMQHGRTFWHLDRLSNVGGQNQDFNSSDLIAILAIK